MFNLLSLLLGMLCSVCRWLLPVVAAIMILGCVSPPVTTPIQTGGHDNVQQTGGIHSGSPVTVAPVITVPPTSTQPEGG